MDQVAITTPKRVKPRRKVKETPTGVPGPAETPIKSGNAEASSSKAPAVVTVVPAVPSADEPGPSIQPEGTISKRQLKKEKAMREAEASGIPLSALKLKHKKKAEVVESDKSGWQCLPLAQSEVSRVPPIWTKDGRHYITAQNSSIYIHSALPPYARQSILSAGGRKPHTAPITSLLLSPLNPKHIVTAAEDGFIKIWDIESGEIVHTVPASGPIWQMCLAEVAGKWTGFITLTPEIQSKKKKPSTRVMHFLYPTVFPANTCPLYQLGRLSAPSTALFVSPTSLYLVALAANKAYTFRLPSEPSSSAWKPQMVKFVTDQPLTCGSFAPTDKLGKGEDWFATGDLKGVIRLWHGLGQAFRLIGPKNSSNSNDEERRLPTTSLHWHAHAVASLAFTPSGSQLLSVGEESVLVQWHLGTGKREYVPRLGGRPIVSLAVKEALRGKEEEWWMAFEDGSVVKVGAGSGNVENVGQGVKIDPLRQITPSTPYPLALHPSTSALVLPSSNPGTLQFIQPGTSLHPTTLLFDLEVSPSNRVSRRDEKELQPVAVEMVAFSDMVSGASEWMATVEGRSGDEWEGGGEVRTLKLWRWDGERYIVNTQFPRPHNLSPITSLAFSPLNNPTSPDRPYLLTTAIDGTSKLWHIRQSKKSEHGKAASKRPATFEYFWSPRSSWTYRSQPVHSASFSPDSTLVVLTHDSVLSLWDTESNVLLRALDAGPDAGQLSLTQFVGAEGRLLVAAGQAGMVCWDLLSCARIWSRPTSGIFALLPLQSGNFMTAQSISHQSVIEVYDSSQLASSQAVSAQSESIKPFESTTISQSFRSLLLLSSTRSASTSYNLAGVSSSGDLFRVTNGLTAASSSTRAAPLRVGTQTREGPSIWQEMFGQHAFIDPSSAPAETSSAPERKRQIVGRASAVFDGPSHTLPPPSLMFDGFMEEILANTAPSTSDAHQGREEDGILYEQAEPSTQEENQVKEKEKAVKGVSNEDIKELEGFFTSILGLNSVSATPKEKKRPNGTLNGSSRSNLNGGISSGTEGETDTDDEGIFDLPVQKPIPKVRSIGQSPVKAKANGLKAIEVGPEEEEEDRSKKGKKRRVPKE